MQKFFRWLISKASPQNWFVVLALLFGSTFALLAPPFLGGDEVFHFTRAYQVANGGFIADKNDLGTGGWVPKSIFSAHGYIDAHHRGAGDAKAAIVHHPLNRQDLMFVSYPNTAVNNPFMYIPQATAIQAGMLFDAPPALLNYFARFANLIFYVALLYVAIRLIPFGKTALMAIALLPMHVVSASSANADTFSLAILALFVATVLHLRVRETRLGWVGITGFMVLVAAMAFTKLPTALFLLLAFFIPPRVLGGNWVKWWLYAGAAALLAIVCAGGWMLVIQAVITPYGPEGVDVAAQMQFMLQNPLHFLLAAATTLFTEVSNGISTTYTIGLTPQGAYFPLWLTLAYTAFLATLFPVAAGKFAWDSWHKWVLGGLMIAYILGVSVLLYLSWTPVGGTQVDGMSPRYLTPLLFLLIPLCAVAAKPPRKPAKTTKWFYILPAAFLAYAAYVHISGFYL